jgi:hypothetical protein
MVMSMIGSPRRFAVAAVLLAAGGVPALAQALLQCSGVAAGVRLRGADARILAGLAPAPEMLPAGDYRFDFGRDALGWPLPLSLSLPAGCEAQVAIERAPLPARDQLVRDAAGFAPRETPGAHLLAARFRARGAGAQPGLLVRGSRDGFGEHGYRLVWDRDGAEFRLERLLGGALLVLARSPAPDADEQEHEMALQTHGFRLRAFCDDVLVAQAMDGALTGGSSSTVQAGAVEWLDATVEPPVVERASSALVVGPEGVQFVNSVPVVDGSWWVVELRLDRPHPLLPWDADGNEPALLQRPAAPQVLLADWRGTLGAGTWARVRDGRCAAQLLPPAGLALRGQVAMVRGLLLSPDGAVVAMATPAVPWRW